MIPIEQKQTLDTVGTVSRVASYGATAKTMPRIFNALSDKIYRYKIRAVIREYSTNAWDEHKRFNLPVKDIIVHLPTLEEPVFKVRDFGAGLSEDEIANIYCIFGESTKRNSNEFNGQLGLGCKAAFAYGDSFTVTSYYNGVKSIYNSIKGDNEKAGEILKISECPMSPDEKTGVEVCIPVKIDNINEFHVEATGFYKHWKELPSIQKMDNFQVQRMTAWRSKDAFLSGEGWEIRPKVDAYNNVEGVAFMGQVPYPINWDFLYGKLSLSNEKRILYQVIQSNNVVLYFDIGTLEFTISREDLEYTNPTVEALKVKITGILDKVIDALKDKIASAPTIWEAKKIYNYLFNRGTYSEDDDGTSNATIEFISGDLYRLKDSFQGKLFWNGIAIDSNTFTGIHHYDLVDGYVNKIGYSPDNPCLLTFKKNNGRVKHLHCSQNANNVITASNGNAIVINDLQNKSLSRSVARYLIFKEKSTIGKVYILRFQDSTQRNQFYKEYNFDTVPVIYLSSIINDVKAFNLANRAKNCGTKLGGPIGVRKVEYLPISKDGNYVTTSNVSIKELEDGGFYLPYDEGKLNYNGIRFDAQQLSLYLNTLVEAMDLDIDKVYAVPAQNRNAKWFQQSVTNGLWINVIDHIKENLDVLDKPSLAETKRNQKVWGEVEVLGKGFTNSITPLLTNKDNAILKIDYKADANYAKNVPILSAIDYINLTSALKLKDTGSDMKKVFKEVFTTYPLLKLFIGHVNETNCHLTQFQLKQVADYINSIDFMSAFQKKDLTTQEQSV